MGVVGGELVRGRGKGGQRVRVRVRVALLRCIL